VGVEMEPTGLEKRVGLAFTLAQFEHV